MDFGVGGRSSDMGLPKFKKRHTLPRPTGGHANVTNVSSLYEIMESFHLRVRSVKGDGMIEI